LLKGKPALWSRVRAISDEERTALYYRTKIGFNMHLSERPMETGNMRMFEVPAHGMMLLCDKAGLNAHERIFEPGKQAVFYDSIEDAIEKIEYYLNHDEEREKIARAGFARVQSAYDGESNLRRFLDWAMAVPKRRCA
jgi:spore maturation protein CgeB